MVLDRNLRAMARPDPATAEKMVEEVDRELLRSTDAVERTGLFLHKANLLWVLNRASEAKQALRLAVEQTPGDPETCLVFDHIHGSFLHQEGNLGDAYVLLTAALSKHRKLLKLPDFRFIYEDIQRYRAFELFAMGDCAKAVPLLEEVLSFESTERERSVALAYLGNCFARMKHYEAALKCLLQALERGDLNDWEGQAHYDLAITYAWLRLLEESKRELKLCAEQAAKYNLPLGKIYAWLSRVCRGLGQKSESEHYATLARPF